jgi:hydrogenase expression/formation protein HypD
LNMLDVFGGGEGAQAVVQGIREAAANRETTLMEVCGTHTMAIARFGIRELLPESVRLVSGPGCPVCVTPNPFVDRAVALSRIPDAVIATFGDMMRVPGSSSSLERERASGRDVRVVFSTLDALKLAGSNPDKKIVFLGVGFETTAPTVAASILEARKGGLNNYSVLSSHKVMPPAMEALSAKERGDVRIDGYICPGHVSAVIGTRFYEKLAREYGIGCVVSGFEPMDVLQSILMLVRQARDRRPKVEVQYSRVVKPGGNPRAMAVLDEVFEPADAEWRGLGMIPGSGLKIRAAFADWDAEKRLPVEVEPVREPKGCRCGDVLRGKIRPTECPLFAKACSPEEPVGACMVSSEGTCAAYFRFGPKIEH